MRSSISKKKLIEFGLLIGFGFPIFFGFAIPLFSGHPFRLWTIPLGIIFLLISFISPNLLFYPYKFWMLLGKILGWINSRLILGLVYLIVLIPIAMIMKLLGYDPLKKRKNFGKESYRENNKNHIIDLKQIF